MHEVKTNVDEFPILCRLSIWFIPESKLELKCAFNLMMGLECAPKLLLESKRDQCCSCSLHRFWYLVQSMMNRYEYFSIMRKKSLLDAQNWYCTIFDLEAKCDNNNSGTFTRSEYEWVWNSCEKYHNQRFGSLKNHVESWNKTKSSLQNQDPPNVTSRYLKVLATLSLLTRFSKSWLVHFWNNDTHTHIMSSPCIHTCLACVVGLSVNWLTNKFFLPKPSFVI